jgi:filamentous hemagglutinin family protein
MTWTENQYMEIERDDYKVSKLLLVCILASIGSFIPIKISHALPELNNISHGDLSVTTATNESSLLIQQNSSHAIVNWNQFNIDAHEAVHFNQPANGVCLNRIDAMHGISQINGKLNATGSIILINEAGILFGNNASVNVGSIIASATDMADENFLADRYIFDQKTRDGGSIINRGSIHVDDHGLLAFLGSSVRNDGLINANLSRVRLASGSKFSLDFYGDGVINFVVTEKTQVPGHDENNKDYSDGVSITGEIINDQGNVLITGDAMQDVFNNLINIEGLVQAKSANQVNGEIVLSGDSTAPIKVSGTLDVSADDPIAGGTGGKIHVIGANNEILDHAVLNASGIDGGGEILIGGDFKGSNPTIRNAISTVIAPEAMLTANAIENGNGGKIIVWSDELSGFFGTAHARGGNKSGNGGLIEISGRKDLLLGDLKPGSLDTSATYGDFGTVLFDPRYLVVATSGGSSYSAGTNNLYANNVGSTNTITPASIVSAGTNITLQANTDVVFTNALAMTTSGASLTVNAGRSVLFNANVSTTNGAITVTANDTGSTSSDRNTTSTGNPSGDTETTTGNITMASGTSVSSGTAALSMTIGSSTTAPYSPGSITLISITGGAVSLTSPNTISASTSIAQSTSLSLSAGAGSTISGTISGAGSVTLPSSNGSSIELSGTNTYTGTTSVLGGVLYINTDASLGTAPGTVTPASITLNNGAILGVLGTFTLNSNRGITLGSGGGSIDTTNNGLTYNGIITGSGALNIPISGGGSLTLGGVNTYTGSTTISGGTVVTAVANAIAQSSAILMGNSGRACTLNLDGFAQTINNLSGGSSSTIGNINLTVAPLTIKQTTSGTYSGVISSASTAATVTMASGSTATLTLGNTNTYTGITTVSGGTLSISSDGNLGTAPSSVTANSITLNGGTLATSGSFTLNPNRGITLSANSNIAAASGTLTYGGIITGSNSITYNGSGTVSLSGINTYTGTTTINNGGTLIINADSCLGTAPGSVNAASITLNNGILEADTSSAFTLNANRGITLGSSGGTIAPTTGTLTYNGIITGTGALTMAATGGGALQLGGLNTYTGQTNINAGTFLFGVANSIQNSSAVVMGASSNNQINFNGFSQTFNNLSGGSSSSVGNINMTVGSMTIKQTSNGTYSGVISAANSTPSVTLSSSSTATLTLANTNTYTGNTIINGGILQAGAANVIASSNALTLANTAGVKFDLNSFNQTVGTLSGGGTTGGNITLGTATLTVNQTAAGSYAGVISSTSSAGGLTLSSSSTNTLTLSGTNTYTGINTLNGGTLSISTDPNLGAAPSSVTATSITFNGGTLLYTSSFTTNPNRGITLTGNGTLQSSGGASISYGGIIAGSGSLTYNGSSIFISGANTYTGTTTITAGTLNVNADNAFGAIPGSVNATSINLSGAILANSSFTLNSNRGITLGSSGGTLLAGGGLTLTYNGIIAGTGTLFNSGSGTIALGGINTYSGGTTINAGGTISISADSGLGAAPGSVTPSSITITAAPGTLVTTGSFTLNANRGITLSSSGTISPASSTTLTYNGIIASSGGLTMAGAGTLVLGGVNTYSGTTTVTTGTLSIAADSGLGTAPASATPSSLTLNSGTLIATTGFTLNPNRGIALSGTGGTFAPTSGTLVYSGIITGGSSNALTVNSSGGGALNLGGSCTYTGPTYVTAGTLVASTTNAIQNTSALFMSSSNTSSFVLAGSSQTIGSLSGGASSSVGSIQLTNGTLTINQTAAGSYGG